MQMNSKNVDELLNDDGFLAWYFKTDQAKIVFWDDLIKNNPGQKKLVDEAVSIIEAIKVKEGKVDSGEAVSRLFEKINETGSSQPAKVIPIENRRTWLRWAAAAVFLVIIGVGAYTYFQRGKPGFETNYAEIRQESLPDGSQVTLNANSKLVFNKNWQKEKENDREVWLDGEAFFQVQKTPRKSKFIVHTSHFDIIVTGTEFNVVNRNEKTNVLLKEGSVLIRGANGENISMKPGDFVEFSNNQVQPKTAKDNQVLAWKERKFIFEKTPMKEVGANIEDLYGISVTFGDTTAATDSISAILPNDNLDVFLQSLEAAQNYEITKNNEGILIRTKR
jgi:transmembrane sensor